MIWFPFFNQMKMRNMKRLTMTVWKNLKGRKLHRTVLTFKL